MSKDWYDKLFGQNGIVGGVAAAITAVVAIVSLTIGGSIGFFAGRVSGDGNSDQKSAAGRPGTTSLPPVKLSFNPPGAPVPRCTSYTGTGSIPDGFSLLIFDRNADEPNSLLYPDGVAQNEGAGWKINKVEAGGPQDVGLHVELVAILVPNDVGDFIGSIVVVPLDPSKNPEAVWKAGRPAPSLLKDRITVTRGSDHGWCGE